MAIDHNDIMEIQKVFDDRYVLQRDCNEIQDGFSQRFANDDKRIDIMALDIKQMRKETKNSLKFNNWLTAAILGALIVGFISFYFFVA